MPSTLVLTFLPLINRHYKTALLGFSIFILSVISLILTGCRGAYIALFIQIIVLMMLVYRYLKPFYRKIYIWLASFCMMISIFVILTISSLKARIFSIFAMRADSSNSFRFNVYNSCLEMFKDNWLLGIGIGNQNFREIYGLYMKTGFNVYLETAVESGIFALITFILFIGINIKNALEYILNRANLSSLYLTIALVSIVGMLIHGFVDTVFFRPQIQFVFWTMMAIIRVLTTSRGRKNARARS